MLFSTIVSFLTVSNQEERQEFFTVSEATGTQAGLHFEIFLPQPELELWSCTWLMKIFSVHLPTS